MTTEQYAVGYETGYKDGWNSATESLNVAPQPAKLEPGNWVVYNYGAEVASRLSFAEALEYLTPEHLAQQWCAVCVVDQSNLPTSPQPAKQPLTEKFGITAMIDVGNYGLQLMFESRQHADQFKAAHGIGGQT